MRSHPQNPDPKATVYFAEHITKAYRALTDDISRANYEKYGHPDGPQVGLGRHACEGAGSTWACLMYMALMNRSMQVLRI
jgi:preprotein translocase subunit Sec63